MRISLYPLLLALALSVVSPANGADGLSAANASSLKLIGSIPLTAASRGIPTPDGADLYLTDNVGTVYRFDAATGATKWQVTLPELLQIKGAIPTRGVAVGETAVVLGLRNTPYVVALDKASGAVLWKQKVDDATGAIVTQTPLVRHGKVFVGVAGLAEEAMASYAAHKCCGFRGSEVALDAASGKLLWKTHTLPEGWAGGSIWSGSPLLDEQRKTLFVTTGNAFRAPDAVQACLERTRGDTKAVAACNPSDAWYNSVLALDPDTGQIKWGFRAEDDDIFTGACLAHAGGICGGGEDHDFGNGAMLWRAEGRDLVGAGQKSGVFWALDPETGAVVWRTRLGPGGPNGGIEFGSAFENGRIFAAEANAKQLGFDPKPYTLPSGQTINYGSYAALDATSGTVLWQVPDPAGVRSPDNGQPCTAKGPKENCIGPYAKGAVTVANGAVLACSTAPDGPMYAFDAQTGAKLWEHRSGVSCDSKATVVGCRVYWVAGPSLLVFSSRPGDRLLAVGSSGTAGKSPDGAFTAAEAKAGEALYRRHCATACHGENLTGGGPAPSLAGADFRGRWAGVSLARLYDLMRTSMPKSKPGSLAARDYRAILAFILSANGFRPGSGALPDDAAMEGISLVR